MRIVYNLRDQDWQTTKSLGVLHVSTRIAAALARLPGIDRLDILANRSLAPHLAALTPLPHCRVHFLNEPAPRRFARLLWDHVGLVRTANRLAPDWLLLPKGFAPLAAWPRCRVSAYVHDDVFGWYARRGERPFPRGEAALFTRMLRRSLARADVVVANSAFTARQFESARTAQRPPLRIGAPLAETPAPAPSDLRDAGSAALLLPTSSWPHKLTRQAVEWLQRWTSETGFAGRIHGFGTLSADTAWPTAWTHHGRASDAAIAQLATAASVLIYFSAYEGYGLPPVEAAAAGRRAIASDLPPLRETLNPAALFDNADYDAFRRTLDRALASPPLAPRHVDTASAVAERWLAALHGAPAHASASTRA